MPRIDLSALPVESQVDWLEILALSRGSRPIGIQAAQSLGEANFGLNPELIPSLFTRAISRSDELKTGYPFEVSSEFIHAKSDALQAPYSAMCVISPGSILRDSGAWDTAKAAKLFEFLAEACLFDFFGSSTRTVNFGFPSAVGRPADFPSAIKWLSELTGLALGASYRPPRKKDGGVDLVIWKEMGDSFGGAPVMLLQATIMGDFINKIGDIDVRLWSTWLSIDNSPLLALAVPGWVVDLNVWSEISARGTLLDRSRLTKLAQNKKISEGAVFLEPLLRLFAEENF